MPTPKSGGRVSHGGAREADHKPRVLKPKQHVPRSFTPEGSLDKGFHVHLHTHGTTQHVHGHHHGRERHHH